MKRFFAVITVSLFLVSVQFAQLNEINIIPKPRSTMVKPGSFKLTKDTKIWAVGGSAARRNAEVLNDQLNVVYGFRLKVVFTKTTDNVVVLRFGDDSAPGTYEILVEPKTVQLVGSDESGMFYAVQSFVQLLTNNSPGKIQAPSVEIKDTPRFPYRGMHLDVARHFMPVEFVKKFIDQMAQFKFNYFHWHLTEDQGWRIEIKKYPKLTEIGSYRSESHEGSYSPTFKGDGKPVSGFYTQEQIGDVVAYAKARHITTIPEIELPGHASAALAAYPQFGCKAGYDYQVKKTWGIFKEVYCPTDETFKFLEDVLDETIKLFPDSPYVHIGGDEVLKDHWKESPFVQELMKRENLKDEHEVQSYFVRRIEKFINSKGKKMIGWDEILEGGVAPNAIIMSWRGMKGGIEAAKARHEVIMTPTDHSYLDYGQGDPAYELLNIGGYLPLEKVYAFEPVPPDLSAEESKYILGGQGNIWTEYMETGDKVEYMAFPRMLAIAETVWSRKEDKNFADFQKRLQAIFPMLEKQGVNYRIPEPGGLRNIVTENEKVTVELKPASGTRVYFTTDGSTPDEKSPVYEKPIEIPLNVDEVKTLKTVVENSSGRKSVVYTATVLRGTMREPVTVVESKQGVAFTFLYGDENAESSKNTGESNSIQLSQFAKQFDLKKPFSVVFDGYLQIPTDGVYELQLDSTWDVSLVFGGEKLIDDAGTKDNKKRSVIVPLKAGLHKISLRYNHRGGDSNFRFRWGIKGRGLSQAYGGEFVH